MTKKGDQERMEELLRGMVGQLTTCATSLGVSRQAIINALTSRLVLLGFEEGGSSAAVAAWFRQVADDVEVGKISALLEFDRGPGRPTK